jgi:hypothetical protein
VLLQGGRQTNPENEQISIALSVDVAEKSIKIDDRQPWPILSDPSETVIVSMEKGEGSMTLNRITGAATIHIMGDGLSIFHGECKSKERLF